MAENRESFGSNFAAIMALAGSAIGLGNIWRFPYMVGQNGGAAFILVYALCALLISLPIMLAESIMGKNTQRGTVGTFRKLAPGSSWQILGYLTVLCPIIITGYYSVVGGWSIEYLFKSVVSNFSALSLSELSTNFTTFSSSVWAPIICHTIFLGLSAVIIVSGVTKGIERFTKLTIPVLFVVMILIMVYSISLPGSMAGVNYLIKPDFSKLTASGISSALGQSFYSLSLGVGTVLTYASYMKNEDNLLKTSVWTAIFDMGFALIAAFAVMPAVFSAGVEPEAGPSLVFETLPFIFANIGANSLILSKVITIAFFLAILTAAITSEISMFEVCTAFLVEEMKLSRKKASCIVFLVAWVLGIVCSLSFGALSNVKIFSNSIFSACDLFSSNILMTLGALFFALFVGWKMDKKAVRDTFTNEGNLSLNDKLFPILHFSIKYIAPVVILIIFVSGLIS